MEYLIAAALLAVVYTAICLFCLFKRKKQTKCLAFRRRKPAKGKRPGHAYFDRNRGKVIPFPVNTVMRHSPNGSDSWQNKK